MTVFSSRCPAGMRSNRLTRAALGRSDLVDLTVTNPTVVGLEECAEFPHALADPRGARYTPEARGLRRAREAVSAYYAQQGAEVDPDRIVLTASSSEAYSWLFKLLCNPGESFLVPAPSYPLLDALAGLEAVELLRYPLASTDGWAVHTELIESTLHEAIGSGRKPRGIVLVNPNNPTGTSISRDEFSRLDELACRYELAIVSDEVFLDCRFSDRAGDVRISAAAGGAAASNGRGPQGLTFSLGGLSKTALLPQAKLGWIAVGGEFSVASSALERLEWIADSFLSVSTPVQLALPALLESRHRTLESLRSRIVSNDQVLRAAFPGGGSIDLLPLRAGWSGVLRIPSLLSEEDLTVTLVEQQGVLVHPGFFFDFPFEAFLVVSLLGEPDRFREGVRRLREGLRSTGT